MVGKSKDGVKRTAASARSDVLGNMAVAQIGVMVEISGTASFIFVCRSTDIAMGRAGLAIRSFFSIS